MSTQPAGLRVIVTGGRDFADRDLLFRTLDRLHLERGFALLIHGAARGADRLANDWAKERRVPRHPVPADWDGLGPAAGPIRNSEMLGMHPDLVVAFPGGRGTEDMVGKAKRAGVQVVEVEKSGEWTVTLEVGEGAGVESESAAERTLF